MFLLSHPAIQYHSTLTAFPGPVKVRIPFPGVEQSLCGMLKYTEFVCPDRKVPLVGLMVMLFTLLVADQLKLRVFELLVSETEHSQLPPV